jgi:penicillin amidase
MTRRLRTVLKWGGRVLLAVLLLMVGAAAVLWALLRGSLATLDGARSVAGLEGVVTVGRDVLGVPTLRGSDRQAVARATGFLHAQDRYFQMDLLRRTAAGELAALLGPPLVEADRRLRWHRFRAVAREAAAQLPVEHRRLLEAYVDGVNAGLQALRVRPPEYLLLRATPQPWQPEDSLLAVHAMFLTLQDSTGDEERVQAVYRQVLPPAAFAFFLPLGTDWDAAVDDSVLPSPAIPTAAEFSFTNWPGATAAGSVPPDGDADPFRVGSNSWAVDGSVSHSGAALVANDMHLGLGLPNFWYRVRLLWPRAAGSSATNEVVGITLPGAPVVVVGSNRRVAWAFTNSGLDTTDIVRLELSDTDPTRYRTPSGWQTLEPIREVIYVRGGPEETLSLERSVWGPVMPAGDEPGRRALRWAAHLPEAVNLRLREMEEVEDVEAALRLAPLCGIPTQNFIVGDHRGQIGWTLMGRQPRRIGFSGRFPESWADGTRRWDGWLTPEEYPRIAAPVGGRLWTANHRVSGQASYLQLGPWGVDRGARARQIRDDLRALRTATPADMLAIQLDDRARFLERWQGLLLATLRREEAAGRPGLGEFRARVEGWGGRAAVESGGYGLVRAFRFAVTRLVIEPIEARCRGADPGLRYGWSQMEQPVWALLTAQPPHLLNPRFKTYDDLLWAAVEKVRADAVVRAGQVAQTTWGDQNRIRVQHPLSRGLPALSRWLDIRPISLPGDSSDLPRILGPHGGASARLAVSPGHEEEGLFHMPGGQSGHFLSPFYRAGHDAWELGRPTPFLPGPTRHRLTLRPG